MVQPSLRAALRLNYFHRCKYAPEVTPIGTFQESWCGRCGTFDVGDTLGMYRARVARQGCRPIYYGKLMHYAIKRGASITRVCFRLFK